MGDGAAGTVRRAPFAALRGPSPTTLVIAAVTVLALVLRLYRLTRPGELDGILGYDDGVYFGASVELVHGHLPYQDFVFVHPPLLPTLMTPFAALTRLGVPDTTAFALARLFSVLVSTACVPLLGRLVRHRGAATAGIACAVLALHSDTIAAGRSVFLEPYLTVFCLAGLLVLFDGDGFTRSRPRLVIGGVLLGLAGAVKVFAVAPVAVVLLVALRRPGRAARILLGAAAGFVVPCLPFLLVSPFAFWRDVVTSQLHRTALRTRLDFRLSNLLGTNDVTGLQHGGTRVVALAGSAVLAAAYVTVWRTERRRPATLELVAIGSALATVAMFVVADQFFWHYAAFFAPFAALAIALPTAGLLRLRVPRVGWAPVATAAVAALVLGSAHHLASTRAPRTPVAQVQQDVPPGACVATDDMSLVLSVDRLSTGRRCPVFVDGLGTDFVLGQGRFGPHAARFPAVRAAWLRSLHGAGFVMMYRPVRSVVPWRVVRPYLRAHFRAVKVPGSTIEIWEANPSGG